MRGERAARTLATGRGNPAQCSPKCEEAEVRCIRISRPPVRRPAPEPDTRTPAGRPLPW